MRVEGLHVRYPNGAFMGYQATCPICGEQVRLLSMGHALVVKNPHCPHYTRTMGDEPILLEFDETEDEAKERVREREIDTRIEEELDHETIAG